MGKNCESYSIVVIVGVNTETQRHKGLMTE